MRAARVILALCGILLTVGHVQAARNLKESGASVDATGHGLGASLLGRLIQQAEASTRRLRQVGSAGWDSSYNEPRDYRLINQLPYSSHMHVANMQNAAGYRGSAAAASAFSSNMMYGTGYGGYAGAYDPYGAYGGYAITRTPYDAAFATTRANAIATRAKSLNPYDLD